VKKNEEVYLLYGTHVVGFFEYIQIV